MKGRKISHSQHALMLNGQTIPYVLRRSARRSLGLQIGDSGLIVSAPQRLPHPDIERSLHTKATWIQSRLAHWRQCQSRMLGLEELIAQGLEVPLQGQSYRIEYAPHLKRSGIDHTEQRITLNETPPSQQASAETLKVLAKKLERLLRPVALQLFQHLGSQLQQGLRIPDFSVHLSAAKCRWGSCNKRNEIRLNWRLVFYPKPVIEYVVAHEMAHLIEMNHSAAFWKVVQSIKPDFQRAHDFLSEMNPEKVPLL